MRDPKRLFRSAPALLLLAACQSPADDCGCGASVEVEVSAQRDLDDGSSADWRTRTTRGGTFEVSWRPVPAPVPIDESFELEVLVRNAQGQPVSGAEVVVRGWMPDHGHGMPRDPRSEQSAEGHYRVRGMLFNMGGYWELTVDVIADGLAEGVRFELEL